MIHTIKSVDYNPVFKKKSVHLKHFEVTKKLNVKNLFILISKANINENNVLSLKP